jgi:hypothetical protein
VRQHVNPLSRVHQAPRPLPPLQELFARPGLPLHLDIGSARGRFLLAMARLHPLRNHLGVEIRRPLVQAAEAERIGSGEERGGAEQPALSLQQRQRQPGALAGGIAIRPAGAGDDPVS